MQQWRELSLTKRAVMVKMLKNFTASEMPTKVSEAEARKVKFGCKHVIGTTVWNLIVNPVYSLYTCCTTTTQYVHNKIKSW